ncbi:MAG: hypothetical protein ABI885_17160 [Gammaproteobacteria bacterium]
MPFAPLWFPRIPDAITQLQQLDRQLITRGDLERLFGVSRALAAKLMHRFGAERVGAQLLVGRSALMRSLQAIGDGDQARGDVTRRAAVASELQRARLEAVHVAVPASVLQTHVAGLPAGVALGPGRIEVQFRSVPEALQKLFALAQAITNDYDRFASLVSGPNT